MTKVFAKNCKITKLPQGWSAKTDTTGICIIEAPNAISGMFGGTITSNKLQLNGFVAESFDGNNPAILVLLTNQQINENEFFEVSIAGEL